MIETLIEAERALTHGQVDQAERLYRQVAASDPKSSIAVMGLARVALERGDDLGAYLQGRAALAIDPENPAAQHLVMRLAEVMAGRGEAPPASPSLPLAAVPTSPAAGDPAPPPDRDVDASSPIDEAPQAKQASTNQNEPPKKGLIGRLLRRRPRSR